MQTALEPEAELIGEKIRAAVPKMTELQKAYLLGFGEALAGQHEDEERKNKEQETGR